MSHYAANAYGLYDMHGNVTEWTANIYYSDYNGVPSDGSAPGEADRVHRGGSWFYNPYFLRSAGRNWSNPSSRNYSICFRLVQDI